MQDDSKQSRSTTSSSSDSKSRKDSQILMDPNKYRSYIEEVKTKNLNTSEMLSASVANMIHPEDSIIYNPQNIHILPTKYPVYPLSLKKELAEKFNEDTLFFMFFNQPDTIMKEIAFRQLAKKGWMYNKRYGTFFQLQGEAIEQNESSIKGLFKYFDHEKDWRIINKKTPFGFDLKDLKKVDN